MSTKNVGAAAIIFNEHGHVLLVKHNYGKYNWEIPGGKSEPYESANQTVIREVNEETGLKVSVGHMTGVYYEEKYDMHHFAFTCYVNDGQVALADMEEVTQCQYFDVNSLPRPISDFTIMRIQDALAQTSKSAFRNIGERIWFE